MKDAQDKLEVGEIIAFKEYPKTYTVITVNSSTFTAVPTALTVTSGNLYTFNMHGTFARLSKMLDNEIYSLNKL